MNKFQATVLTMFPGLANKNRALNSIGPVAKAPSKYAKLAHNKGMFNAGRNAEKRKPDILSTTGGNWHRKIATDQKHRAGAKINGYFRREMLADRRLRQRALAA